MTLSYEELSHWLDCLDHVFRYSIVKTIDEIYAELLDRFILEEELRQIQLDFMDSFAP